MELSERLRQTRLRANLTQRELARRAAISEEAISQYERGVRRPTRRAILRLAQGGGFDAAETDALLRCAGYSVLDPLAGRGLVSLAEIFREAGTLRWPCLVLNETADVVAWNEPANRVAELDFARDLPQRYQRSLFHIAALDHFRDRVRNWPDVMRVMAQMYKNNDWEIAQVEREPAYYQRLIAHIAEQHTAGFNALWAIWSATPPPGEERRWTFRAEWRLADGTELNFNCVIGPWDTLSAGNAFDWFPADGATWRWLDATAPASSTASPSSRSASSSPATPFEAAHKPIEEQANALAGPAAGVALVGHLLRSARDYLGLSRRQVAERSGMSQNMLLSIERGRRRPTEDRLARLMDVLELDGVTINAIRTALGMEPVASDLTRFIAGQPQRRPYWHFPYEVNAARARERLPTTVAAHPWPCLIVDERCAIVAESGAMRRLVGHSLLSGAEPHTGHLLRTVFGNQFRSRVVNWPDLAGALIPANLRLELGSADGAGDASPLGPALGQLLKRHPQLEQALRELAGSARVAQPRARVVLPLVWHHDDGTLLAFICVIGSWTAHHRLWAIDWHPADAESWDWFAKRT